MLLRPRVDVQGGQQLCTNDKAGLNTHQSRKARYWCLADPKEDTPRFQCVGRKYLKKKTLCGGQSAEPIQHHP